VLPGRLFFEQRCCARIHGEVDWEFLRFYEAQGNSKCTVTRLSFCGLIQFSSISYIFKPTYCSSVQKNADSQYNKIWRSGIQFTWHFTKFVFMARETNQLVSSNPNVILTWQTCSQRSIRAGGSNRRGLAFYFPAGILFPRKFARKIKCQELMFLISKCRGESDLILYMTCGCTIAVSD